MFLLRCTFWLSIVYASMSWGGKALQHHESFASVTADRSSVMETVAERAVASVSSFCQEHEAQCLRDAASMTTLVQATLEKDDPDEAIVPETADIPLPTPDPRRRVASAVLTRVR